MRRSDFWERLNAVLGAEYAASWSRDVVLPSLGDTVEGCFDRGEDTVVVWRAVCEVVDVPSMLR
ncbi:MAG: DUF3046 domain-containing protein [Actinobacteria bacterium]|jgi:hypothetical protein|nr:DUF3046 domain-containing protein [Candidatus Nanopelagicales bacterium]NDH24076.1 DUF3046 domain-containing protein [Actinomycetota bacterium]NKB91465.1 DUF3046 domain-containing protein [Candidatus Nanopelagicales bacterium]